MAPEFLQAALGFAALLGLIALRCPVGLAMLLVGAGGYLSIVDLATLLNYLKTTPWHLFASYTLSVIPLFILMGAIAERGGLARDLFAAANALIGHRRRRHGDERDRRLRLLRRGLRQRVATTATFGRAALPELRRYGYDPGLSTGTIAVGGTLGILIPPSVILVVYAISTEQNIAKLFMAALMPGLLAALFYILAIAVLARLRPALMPAAARVTGAAEAPGDAQRRPVLLIAVVVVGGIYGGIFTPTESAAIGCIATLAVGSCCAAR